MPFKITATQVFPLPSVTLRNVVSAYPNSVFKLDSTKRASLVPLLGTPLPALLAPHGISSCYAMRYA